MKDIWVSFFMLKCPLIENWHTLMQIVLKKDNVTDTICYAMLSRHAYVDYIVIKEEFGQ